MDESEQLINKSQDLIEEQEEDDFFQQDSNKYDDKQMFLNPLEKYAIFNKFPFVLLVHLFLVCFTLFQLITLSNDNEIGRNFKHFLYEFFLPLNDDNDEKEKTDYTYQQHLYIYNIEDLIKIVNQTLDTYYNIENIALENITQMYKINDETPQPPKMILDYRRAKEFPKNVSLTFDLTMEDFGPFNDKEIAKSFMDNITSFKIQYHLMSYFSSIQSQGQQCIGYDIEQIYSFENFAQADLYLNYQKVPCPNFTYVSKYIWLSVIVIILAFLSLFLLYLHVAKRYKLYWFYKNEETNKYLQQKKQSSKLKDQFAKEDFYFNYLANKKKPIDKIFKIVDKWTILALLANVFQIMASMLIIFDPLEFNSITGFLTSMGTIMSIIIFIKYLENLGSYSIIYETLIKGLPPSIDYLVGVMPIFIGYCVCGKCLFWRSEYFYSLTESIAVLFGLMNGDSAILIFDDIFDNFSFLGIIYCVTFDLLFFVVIMGVFLAIIGEYYVSKKQKKYKHWVYYVIEMEEKEKQERLLIEEKKEAEKNKSRDELLEYRLSKIYEEFDKVQKLSVIITLNSTTKNIVELRSKFNEQLSILDKKMDRIKRTINIS